MKSQFCYSHLSLYHCTGLNGNTVCANSACVSVWCMCVYIFMCIHIFKLLFCLVVIVWYSFLLPTTASCHTHEQIFGVNHISLPPPELNFHPKNGIWYQGRGLSPLKLLLQSVFLYPHPCPG